MQTLFGKGRLRILEGIPVPLEVGHCSHEPGEG